MIDSIDHLVWTEKYRPQTVAACILPQDMKKIFASYVAAGEITSHLLLAGGSGSGKTTVARAMLNEMGADYMFINASIDRNIDTLRTTIFEYASKVSMFGGKRKYIILDEADNLNPTSMQPGLRGAMDELSVNCGIIMTCNFKNKIIDPVQGRCSLIEFRDPKGQEKKEMLMQTLNRVGEILKTENVPFDRKVLLHHINKYFPNIRKAINELQSYAQGNGSIDEGILTSFSATVMAELIKTLKERQFTEMRKWVGENSDVTIEEISKYFYDHAIELMVPQSIPMLVKHLSDFDYRSQFVVNKEITVAAMLTNIMGDVEWL